jgi:hypothetical protein
MGFNWDLTNVKSVLINIRSQENTYESRNHDWSVYCETHTKLQFPLVPLLQCLTRRAHLRQIGSYDDDKVHLLQGVLWDSIPVLQITRYEWSYQSDSSGPLHILCALGSNEHYSRLKQSRVFNLSKIHCCQNFTELQNAWNINNSKRIKF